ncbi:MAG: hypothetical protein ABI204_08965 [Ginsengibacter sp.]
MKFTIAYYLLLLYCTAIFQPLIAIAIDAWSHTFAEANHIATVHMIYGTHHLDVSLANANSDDTKSPNKMKVDDSARVHIAVKEYNYCLPALLPSLQFHTIIKSKFLSVFILKHTPPPKFF